ncbi:unnamed protein product [Meganyctiphanes norvegica]|uniref:Uncharacterized protein n=1 Tax=Meganyctiphanes norvegica TaxID=48144 RepID=A0AAV2RWA1_MEGNR
MAEWCIATLVFAHIFTVFGLPREQFDFSSQDFDNPLSTLPRNTFNSDQTTYSTISTLTNDETFRLNLPGWTRHAEVLPHKNVESDFTDHVTGYTAPAINYFASLTGNRDRSDSSEEQESFSNKKRNGNAATSSVFFRLGNSPVTQYRVVHEPSIRHRGRSESKKMITIEKARFIGMSRNPPDFKPFIGKQSSNNFSLNQNQKAGNPVKNSESIQAQYIGKTVNPPDFNPFIAKPFLNNVTQYQIKKQNPHISFNNGANIQTYVAGENVKSPELNLISLKPTVSVERNISLPNTNSKRIITFAGENKENLPLDNSNGDVKSISFLNPHLINYQQQNIKDLVTTKTNIKSTFPALFIKNITPKILIQTRNLTYTSNLALKRSQNSPKLFPGLFTNSKPPQVQLTNRNVQNNPGHTSLLSSAIQNPNVKNIPMQRNLIFSTTNPIQKSVLLRTFTLPNIDKSSIQKNVSPSVNTHTSYPRIITQKSTLGPKIAQSNIKNSSVHTSSKSLLGNSHISDSEGIQLQKEDSVSQQSEKKSIPGTNFQFELPRTDDTYFYSYDINSNKRPEQFNGRNLGQAEKRENGRTTGRYYVQLPDGRTQVVTYYADHTGYHPTVSYFGTKNI